MIFYFMKMSTEISTANSISSNASSFGDSKKTEVSNMKFLSSVNKGITAKMGQEILKEHLDKLPPRPKRRRLKKFVGLESLQKKKSCPKKYTLESERRY